MLRPTRAAAGKLPEVASFTELITPTSGQPTGDCSHPINSSDLSVGVFSPEGRSPWKLVSGRLPDPSAPDQWPGVPRILPVQA